MIRVFHSIKVTVHPDDMGEVWPDHTRRFSRSIVIRPDRLTVTFTRKNGEPLTGGSVAFSGLRVLKDGSAGEQRHSDSLWNEREWPKWVHRAVEEARKVALEALA